MSDLSQKVLDELQKLMDTVPSGGEGFTTQEAVSILRCGGDRARKLIKNGIEQGVLETFKKPTYTMDGRIVAVPAYRKINKEEKKKKK